MRAIVSIMLIASLLLGIAEGARADEYSSASFIVRDPAVSILGGDSISGSFESVQTGGQAAIGESVGSSFIVQSGFAYYGLPIATQSAYRWYENTDAVQPTTALAAQNTSISNVNTGDIVRLRVSLRAPSDAYPKDTQFKLQYAPQGASPNCVTVPSVSYIDVGGIGSGSIWRGYDNPTPVDGASISARLLTTGSGAGSHQTYEEANPSVPSPDFIYVGVNADAEWDWVVQNNGATGNTPYCFRMALASGTALNSYTNIARLVTTPTTVTITSSGGGSTTIPTNTSIAIDTNLSCASTRDVSLTLTAQNADEVIVSNNPDFIGSSWEPFTSSPILKSWTLTSGDGIKQVYALFRHASGGLTGTLSDIILLDQTTQCGTLPLPVLPEEIPDTESLAPDQPRVIVFSEPNYRGRSEMFTFDDPDLRDNLIGNDAIASIRVYGDAMVTLFEHINYGGTSAQFSSDHPDVRAIELGVRGISAIRFDRGGVKPAEPPLRPVVQLFEHINYGGVMQEFFVDHPDFRGIPIGNDRVSSARVFFGAIARIFEHILFNGVTLFVTKDIPDFRALVFGNDRASSIRVIVPGAILKGSSSTVYYYGHDLELHPFISEAAYFTWFADYRRLHRVTDEELFQIPVGSSIGFRPGIAMVKLPSDARVYAVSPGRTLRWIINESVAEQVYGAEWIRNIRDIHPDLLSLYTIGAPITSSADYDPLAVAARSSSPR